MDFLENINEISNGFDQIKLKKIKPFEVEFSIQHILKYREFLAEKGYLYLRMPILSKKVEMALSLIEEFLKDNGYMNDQFLPISKTGILLSGYRPITHHTDFLNLVECKELKYLMSCILQEQAETIETKWIRVLGPKEYTNTHSDYYKFSRSKEELYTCWMPLKAQGLKEGTLCICEESHRLNFETEENIRNYELPSDFLKFVEKSKWIYADFEQGDLMIFNIKTIHCSFRNDSSSFRINCDTRWYPSKKKY